MSKSNAWESALLDYVFNGTAIPGLGADLYWSLHTADPGEAGDQTTNEIAYTSYARVAVTRGSYTRTGNSVSPNSAVAFPQPGDVTGLPVTATHFGIGTAASGAGMLMYSGAVTPNLAIVDATKVPRLTTASEVTED